MKTTDEMIKNQTITFKVMFKYRKGIWRKIEMKATQTLEDLHEAIQDAIDWGDDHRFEVEVVDFGKAEKGKKYPVLVESKGKSPEQYPYYDEE